MSGMYGRQTIIIDVFEGQVQCRSQSQADAAGGWWWWLVAANSSVQMGMDAMLMQDPSSFASWAFAAKATKAACRADALGNAAVATTHALLCGGS